MAEPMSADQLRARLARIEGQIRGISKMLEGGRACEDVVTQLMAVRSGIDTVGALVLDTHLATCVQGRSAADQVETLRESMRLWWRFAPASGGLAATAEDSLSAAPTNADPA